MKRPKFSICIPVYNGAATIGETLASVLEQSFRDTEILVQDNGSTDNTVAIVQEAAKLDPRISMAKNSHNLGMVGNWNAVLDRATGEAILLLSADDCLYPNYLTNAMEAFKDQEVDAFSSNHTLFWTDGSRNRSVRIAAGLYQNHAALVLLKNPFSINFTCFRKSALDAMRVHKRVFRRFLSCDYDLHLRFALSGRKLAYKDENLGRYRLHENNLSKARRRMNRHAALTVLGLRRALLVTCPWVFRVTLIRFFVRTLLLTVRGANSDRRLAQVLWSRSLGK